MTTYKLNRIFEGFINKNKLSQSQDKSKDLYTVIADGLKDKTYFIPNDKKSDSIYISKKFEEMFLCNGIKIGDEPGEIKITDATDEILFDIHTLCSNVSVHYSLIKNYNVEKNIYIDSFLVFSDSGSFDIKYIFDKEYMMKHKLDYGALFYNIIHFKFNFVEKTTHPIEENNIKFIIFCKKLLSPEFKMWTEEFIGKSPELLQNLIHSADLQRHYIYPMKEWGVDCFGYYIQKKLNSDITLIFDRDLENIIPMSKYFTDKVYFK